MTNVLNNKNTDNNPEQDNTVVSQDSKLLEVRNTPKDVVIFVFLSCVTLIIASTRTDRFGLPLIGLISSMTAALLLAIMIGRWINLGGDSNSPENSKKLRKLVAVTSVFIVGIIGWALLLILWVYLYL